MSQDTFACFIDYIIYCFEAVIQIKRRNESNPSVIQLSFIDSCIHVSCSEISSLCLSLLCVVHWFGFE